MPEGKTTAARRPTAARQIKELAARVEELERKLETADSDNAQLREALENIKALRAEIEELRAAEKAAVPELELEEEEEVEEDLGGTIL